MKKIKYGFVIICLVFGSLFSYISAQSAAKSYQGWGEFLFWTEVYCDGVMVDYVEGVLKTHIVQHSRDGMTAAWTIFQGRGEEAVSLFTGEVFKYKEMDKVSNEDGTYTWHYHLKGDMGHDYMGVVVWDMITGDVTPGPTNCH